MTTRQEESAEGAPEYPTVAFLNGLDYIMEEDSFINSERIRWIRDGVVVATGTYTSFSEITFHAPSPNHPGPDRRVRGHEASILMRCGRGIWTGGPVSPYVRPFVLIVGQKSFFHSEWERRLSPEVGRISYPTTSVAAEACRLFSVIGVLLAEWQIYGTEVCRISEEQVARFREALRDVGYVGPVYTESGGDEIVPEALRPYLAAVA